MVRSLALLLVLAATGCNSLRIPPAPGLAPVTDAVPAPPLVKLWDRNVEGAFGPSPAVVAPGGLLVATLQGQVVALDPATGRIVGKQNFGDSIEGPFARSPDGRRLFVGAAQPGQVIAHDLRSGNRAWRWRGGAPEAGLVQVGERLVAPLADGTLLGLDAATGRAAWQRRPDSTARFVAPPLALRADVVVADDRGTVRLVEAATGAERWTADLGEPVGHRPAADASAVFVPTTRGRLVALDAATGAERWRADLRGAARVAPRVGPPSVRDGLVVVGASNGALAGLDAATGAERWRRALDGHVNSAPLLADGRVYVGTTDERLLVLDAATGATVWETELRGRVKSAVAGADGAVYVFSEPRHVTAFGPAL